MGYYAECAIEEDIFGVCLDCDMSPCICDELDNDECIECGGFVCGICGGCPDCGDCPCEEDEEEDEDDEEEDDD